MIRLSNNLYRRFSPADSMQKYGIGKKILGPWYRDNDHEATATKLYKDIENKLQSKFNIKRTKEDLSGLTDNKIGGELMQDFFFEKDEYTFESKFAPKNGGIGDAWSLEVLRSLNIEQLHELWYVLIIERNKLYNQRHEYQQKGWSMPNEHRLEFTAISIDNLKTVIEEREQAKNMLLLGRPEKFNGQFSNHITWDADEIHWKKEREWPVPKENQFDHIKKFSSTKAEDQIHPDGDIPHYQVREWQMRKQEIKFKETHEYYRILNQKWYSYRKANPNIKLSDQPPDWWLDLEENQPVYRNGVYVVNLPLVNQYYKEPKKIIQNAPGDPNI